MYNNKTGNLNRKIMQYKVSYTDGHGTFRVTEPCLFPSKKIAYKEIPFWARNVEFTEVLTQKEVDEHLGG